jgi:hypothetical protein
VYSHKKLVKGFKPTAAIGAFLAVKFGADDQTITLATAVGDLTIGFTNEIAAVAADVTNGNLIDVVLDGVAEATAGAAITRGARLTINSTGQVVTAAPASGVNNQIIGIALASAASADEVIPVLMQRSIMQGA